MDVTIGVAMVDIVQYTMHSHVQCVIAIISMQSMSRLLLKWVLTVGVAMVGIVYS